MKALTFHGKEQVRYESVVDPAIESPTDVIIRIEAAAICGSDLHPYFERERGLDLGTVMGHEAVGIVEEIGKNVRQLRKGDRVLTPFTTCCGHCFFCRRGLTARCAQGQLFGWVEKERGLQGLQAEFARVPLADATLLKVPEGVSVEEAILLADVLSTGFYCAEKAELTPESVCAVVGCGPVGLMAVLAAKELGAKAIFAIDPIAERQALARRFGATGVMSPETSVEELRSVTDGLGADAVLDAVGNASAARLAFELVRTGGVISTVGVSVDTQLSFSPVEAYGKNLTYRVGRCPARHYMEKLLPLVQAKRFPLSALFSHRVFLGEGPQAYRLFASRAGGCTKVLLTPTV